uniref:Resistance to inhibitors of cholinesterase protein 3 N-terminal domain-containing protein n=1 Tax=Cacopsylla melanoneura TaxID=428564 RepID=A0A8D9AE22_9HEMI
MATSELSRGKTIFVLTVVAGCFAVLWPKIFYPMFFGSPQFQTNVEKAHAQMRQERPPHMRPEMLHPALRENGRAIPHEHIVPRVEPDPVPRPVKQPGGPKPGMGRPAFGGGGPHAAKQGGGGIMNLLMPMYTISIVAFFIYTMLRIWDPMVMFVKLVLQFVSNSSNNARDGRNASSTDYYSSSTTELRSTSYYQEEYCAPGNGAGKKQLPEPDAKPAAPAKEQEKPGSNLGCAPSGG